MAERVSSALTKAMLSIFVLLFGFAVLLGIIKGLEHKSYLLAFTAAVFAMAVYILLRRKLAGRQFLCDRANPVKLGLILTAVCFLVNLVYVLAVRLEPTVDFYTFWVTAERLAQGRELLNRVYIAAFPHILGYSAFLSIFLRIFGEHYLVAAVLNVVLTSLSCLLIYMLCLRWFGVRAACFAALFWIVCPSKMMYNSMVLSEPFYTFLFLAVIYIIATLHQHHEWGVKSLVFCVLAAVLAGCCLAAANAARPIAAVVIIAFFIWLLLLRGNELRDRALWKKWAVFAAVLLAAYSLYGNAWNRYAEDTVGEEIPSFPGYNFYVGFNTEYWGSYSSEDMDLFEMYLSCGEYTVVEAQELMLEHAKERISSGNIDFAKLFVKKLQTFLGCDEGGAYYSKAVLSDLQYSLLATISNIWYYVLAMLVLESAVKLMRKKVDTVFYLVPLFVLGLTLAQMLVEIAGRYHYSVIPMLIIIAAVSAQKNKPQEADYETKTLDSNSLL